MWRKLLLFLTMINSPAIGDLSFRTAIHIQLKNPKTYEKNAQIELAKAMCEAPEIFTLPKKCLALGYNSLKRRIISQNMMPGESAKSSLLSDLVVSSKLKKGRLNFYSRIVSRSIPALAAIGGSVEDLKDAGKFQYRMCIHKYLSRTKCKKGSASNCVSDFVNEKCRRHAILVQSPAWLGDRAKSMQRKLLTFFPELKNTASIESCSDLKVAESKNIIDARGPAFPRWIKSIRKFWASFDSNNFLPKEKKKDKNSEVDILNCVSLLALTPGATSTHIKYTRPRDNATR